MSVFWTLMSAISAVSGNFVTRCPKCSAKMRREEKHDQAYQKIVYGRGAASFSNRTGIRRHMGSAVQIVPVLDVCTGCGHQVRRKSLELGK